jgi:3-oxoacyl-[acyl-carrier-protein] synthase II
LDRSGFVVGEGAGFLVLENRERAERRGVKILAEIRGASEGCDAWRVTDPGAGGEEAEACVRGCLEDAEMAAGEVDTVVAHGTGTLANDRAEAEVLRRIFGRCGPRVVTPKAALGHLSMACGAVESVLAVKCLQEGCLAGPGPGDWKIDPECVMGEMEATQTSPPRNILKPSFGFGGQNACVVFSKHGN